MKSANKTVCHQEAQEESSNPAALIELEFANLLKQIQQVAVQQETAQQQTVQHKTVQQKTVQQQTVKQETEQVFSAPPTSATNKESSRKRNRDDTEEVLPLPPPSFRELLDFLEEFGQDLEQAASEPSTNNLAPSPKKSKLSDYQPSTSQKREDTSKELDLFETVNGEELTKFLKQFEQEMGVVASEPFESNMRQSSKRTKVSDNHPSTRQSTSYVLSTATWEKYLVENKPNIKKPLNAFMLFWAEQRQRVARELGIADCARVNTELGRRWKMLSKEDKAPYFEQALRERRAHKAKYPEWSAKDNFVRQRNAAAPNYHFGFPPNQQPWPYATGPRSFPPQAPYRQGLYYPAWGPSWGPYYQPGVPSKGPCHQARGPYRHLSYQVLKPSKEPSGDTVTDNDQAHNDQALNNQALNDQAQNERAPNEKAPNEQAVNEQAPNKQAQSEQAPNEQSPNKQALNDPDPLFSLDAFLNLANEAQGFIQGLLQQPFNP